MYYYFKEGDYFDLYKYFEDCCLLEDWLLILEDVSADSVAKSFTGAVKNGIDRFIPQRLSKPKKYPAWFLKDLIHYVRKKAHCHKMYKKNGAKTWYARFSTYRSLLKKLFMTSVFIGEQ